MLELVGLTRAVDLGEVLRALAFFAGGTLGGYVFYRVLLRLVRRDKTITSWGGDDIILAAVRDLALVWSSVGGAFIGARTLPLDDEVSAWLDRAFALILIASGVWVSARTAANIVRFLTLRSGAAAGRGSSILLNVTRIAIAMVGALVLLQTLGLRIGPLLAALGVGGLAIALALQEPMANFFAGLQILATKKVRPGHYVRIDSGEEGFITDIDWRHSSIRQLPDNMILVPNKRLVDATITNYDYPDAETALLVDVRVDYRADLDHVERVTVDVAREVMEEVDGGVPGFEPFVRFHTFADSGIDFKVILRIRNIVSQYLVRHEFMKRLKRAYHHEGIGIPFPVVSIDQRGRADGEGMHHRVLSTSSKRDRRTNGDDA